MSTMIRASMWAARIEGGMYEVVENEYYTTRYGTQS